MTPEGIADLARQIALLNKAVAELQGVVDMVSAKIDVAQERNVKHIQHLGGEFREAVERRADRSDKIALDSSELYAQAHRENIQLGKINANMVTGIDPLCDNLDKLTSRLRGLTGSAVVAA